MTNQSALIFNDVPTLQDVPAISFAGYQGESLEIKNDYIFDLAAYVSVATNVNACFYDCTSLQSLTLPEGFGSVATNVSSCFYGCTSLQSLTLSEGFGSVATNVSSCFNYCKSLTSLYLPDSFGAASTNNTSAFVKCTELTTINGNPQFKTSVSFADSTKLTVDSLMVVIYGLQTVTETQTLTLGTTNLAKLTDEQKQVAYDKGWTLA